MPILESALSVLAKEVYGQIGRETVKRAAKIADTTLSEISESAELSSGAELAHEVPAEILNAQAESQLLEREVLNDQLIQEASPYSEHVTDYIRRPEEVKVYEAADLKDATVNDRPCLVRSDIDLEVKDDFGRTNAERMQNGLSPLDKTGKPHELHHIGQSPDSPLAELTHTEHNEHSGVLHERCESSIDRVAFADERKQHWVTRATQIVE